MAGLARRRFGAGVTHGSGIAQLSTLGDPAWDRNRLAEILISAEGNRPVDNSGTQNGAVGGPWTREEMRLRSPNPVAA